MADQRHVEQWLIRLGSLASARLSSDEATEFVDKCAGFLAGRFPDGAFSPASLEHVAAECKYLPTYGEIVAILSPWWADNVPVATLPHDPLGLNDEDRAIVRNWERHASGDWGKNAAPRNPGSVMRNELTRLHRNRSRVFQHLVANHPLARRIAVSSGLVAPLRAAADPIRTEAKRGPIVDDPP
jgi:hypothetical protein